MISNDLSGAKTTLICIFVLQWTFLIAMICFDALLVGPVDDYND